MLMLEPASKEVVEKVYRELNATPEEVQEGALLLIQWFAKQPHLPKITGQFLPKYP